MANHEFKISILLLIAAVMAMLGAGALIFHILEGWSYVDSLYFVTATATTVGYGDITPSTDLTKIITMIYSLSIIPFVLYIFSIIAKFETQQAYKKIHALERKQYEQEEDMEKTEERMKEQRRKIKEQEEELEKQQTKLKEQTKINEAQNAELDVQEAELDAVADIVEDTLTDTEPKPAKPAKKKRAKKK